jgi:hypothetical protein
LTDMRILLVVAREATSMRRNLPGVKILGW